ncbi:MAG: HmuY family protein [Bacteroidota bacterium]
MKQLLLIFALFICTLPVNAQFMEVTQGPGYSASVYLDLATKEMTTVDYTEWDVAFNVGRFASSVFVNEAIASSRSEELLEVQAFTSSATDFASADTSMITNRLHNSEVSWTDGAFDSAANPADPFDLGWGTYSPATQTVSGSRIFFVSTRDGNYHKFHVSSLVSGVYTFVHGPIDGSSVDTVTIDKADFVGKNMAYFSFSDGVLDLEPASWHLKFTRYGTPQEIAPGEWTEYVVTGVLHASGVSVAEVYDPNPETVAAPTDEAAYSDTLDVIGFDWKTLESIFPVEWSLPSDLVYFVKTPDSLYRVRFVDFEGSGTGISTIQIGNEGVVATTNRPATVNRSRLYPNPAPQFATLELEAKQSAEGLRLEIIDPAGRILQVSRVPSLSVGTNRIEIPLGTLPSGNYFVRLSGSLGVLTHHLIKQ